MATLEQLRAKSNKASQAYWTAERAERNKKNAKMVGRCFKFRNSYGSAAPDESWWLYLRVMCVDDGSLRCFKFEKRHNGSIEIEPDAFKISGFESNYQPIRRDEFDQAWLALQAEIAAL